MMKLSMEDVQLFYQLFFSILDYVNHKHHVCKELPRIAQDEQLNPEYVMKVADYLWEHTEIIDKYLKKTDLPAEHQAILSSWKNRVRDHFVLERNLKKGSVFISFFTQKVYLVSGITSGWEEILAGCSLPVLMDATLIPFKDVIITDGLVNVFPVLLGSGCRSEFKEIYMNAKKQGIIYNTLNHAPEKKQAVKWKKTCRLSYIISVSLEKGCYRHIRVSADNTLDDLAGYILDAFDFDFDHLYSFFMDDQWWSGMEYTSPYSDNPPYASEVKLAAFDFQKGEKFKFLYDYGDEWCFQCKILQLLEEETEKAVVVTKKGKAPEQYPEYDEE